MGFLKKIWKNRSSEYPNRRKLTPAGAADTYDVSREEGVIFEEGDAFSQENMNALEQRIADGFDNVGWDELKNKPTAFTPSAHNQTASTITAGTLAGQVVANAAAVAMQGTAQVRNIRAGTSDMTPGSTALANGEIYLVYE